MAAANTDKLKKKKSLFSTTLSSGISNSDTTIPCASLSGLPTDTAVLLTIDRVDANGNSTPSLTERVIGVVSSNNLTSCLRGRDSSSAQSHSSGAIVEDIWDALTWNDMVDWGLVAHNQDGTHKASAVYASPKITTGIYDSNGNELFLFTATSSAVNEITYANAATGNNPTLQASGGDSNVGIDIKTKASGYVRFRRTLIVEIFPGDVECVTGDGKFYFTAPPELNGMVISAVHARVVTAGTTGTMDIQIANVTDGVDVLSTKLTIDSTETGSDTAATPAVINTSNDDVSTNDLFRVDIDAVQTTKAKGLILRIEFNHA